jgi:hypothetical protein
MPVVPSRSRKALEELARVCNKLATELTADLKHAVDEIETLKREVSKIRRSPATGSKTPRNKQNRASRAKTPTSAHKKTHISEAARQKGPAHESSSFVFPKEPLNPPIPPSEPTTGPENN